MRYFIFFIITLPWLPLAQATTDCAIQTDIPESECQTLLLLFNSTKGAGWFDLFEGGWNMTNTPCSWAGITCRDEHVIAIDRQNNGLTGYLPDLTNLAHLEKLDLSHNQLNGSISSACLPSSLQELSLSDNQLSGTAPDLTHFSNLKTVNFGNNQLASTPQLLPQLVVDTGTIDDNDVTILPPIETGTIDENDENETIILPPSVSGVHPCPKNKLSISSSCNASGNTLPCNVTIEEGASIAQAVFECDAENKGWISNSTIKAGATVQGGVLTGGISNEGILADFEFRGRSIIGGYVVRDYCQ